MSMTTKSVRTQPRAETRAAGDTLGSHQCAPASNAPDAAADINKGISDVFPSGAPAAITGKGPVAIGTFTGSETGANNSK